MAEIKSYDQIEIRSEEVQEILGSTPKWILRSGISVVAFLILVLLIGSWFFKYPDIIQAPVKLTTINPPAELQAYASGNISQLFVNDKEDIEKDELIAIIENPAKYDSIALLKSVLPKLTKDSLNNKFFRISKLGDIQSAYNSYCKLIIDYKNFNKLDYYTNKINGIKSQIKDYNKYIYSLKKQSKLKSKELDLQKLQFKRKEDLFKDGVITKLEIEQAEQSLLQQEMSFETTLNSISNTNMQISQLKQQILDAKLNHQQEINSYKSQLEVSKTALKVAIDRWEKTFVIKSPIKGKLSLSQIWSKNQNVNAGELIATIIPDKQTNIIGRTQIPSQGVGKVESGQRVNIKLDNYPYMEYGMLRAKVKSISDVPIQSENGVFYIANLDIADTLVSNYSKQLDFNQEMTGTAEIITDDVRLLQRFIYPIKALIEKNIKN